MSNVLFVIACFQCSAVNHSFSLLGNFYNFAFKEFLATSYTDTFLRAVVLGWSIKNLEKYVPSFQWCHSKQPYHFREKWMGI